MAKNKLSDLRLLLGRFLGHAKTKNKDITQLWLDQCNALGKKPTDRLLELLSWDLQNQGVPLVDYKAAEEQKYIQDSMNMVQLMNEFIRMKQQDTMERLRREEEFIKMFQKLQQEIGLMRMTMERSGKKDERGATATEGMDW